MFCDAVALQKLLFWRRGCTRGETSELYDIFLRQVSEAGQNYLALVLKDGAIAWFYANVYFRSLKHVLLKFVVFETQF